jgi:urease accessory protein
MNKTMKNSMRGVIAHSAAIAITLLTFTTPAIAHHASGGEAPKSVLEGFITGLAHPVIGLDHFAFVIAIGLLAAVLRRGLVVPIAFLLAALAGTGLHLAALDLPAAELMISASVLLFGLLIATGRQLNIAAVVALSALAGIFHGYAYGEAVVGAEVSAIVAYLIGFTVIQGVIATAAYLVVQRGLKGSSDPSAVGTASLSIRYAGFIIVGAGIAFLSNLFL